MKQRGFTLIELLVVLAIIGSLLTIVAPRFFHQVDRANEAVLRENLYALRSSIDNYYSDKGHYPISLEDLIRDRYLRQLPIDPLTEKPTTWKAISSKDPQQPGIMDVKSGAPGSALDGSPYAEW